MGTQRKTIIAGLSMCVALGIAACDNPMNSSSTPPAAPETSKESQPEAAPKPSETRSSTPQSSPQATEAPVNTSQANNTSPGTNTPPVTDATPSQTATPPIGNCPWPPMEDIEPGQHGMMYCDGQWAQLGWANTDGIYFVRNVDGTWQQLPNNGQSMPSGYPCYDVDYWASQGAPEAITNSMLSCDSEPIPDPTPTQTQAPEVPESPDVTVQQSPESTPQDGAESTDTTETAPDTLNEESPSEPADTTAPEDPEAPADALQWENAAELLVAELL